MANLAARYDRTIPKGSYSVIMFIEGNEIVAENAKGDRIAREVAGIDDAAIFAKAYNSLSEGQTLFINITGSLYIPSTVTLGINQSSIIGPSTTYNPNYYSGCKVVGTGNTGDAFSITGKGITIENITFYDCYNAIRYDGPSNVIGGSVKRCNFKDNRNYSIYFDMSSIGAVGSFVFEDLQFSHAKGVTYQPAYIYGNVGQGAGLDYLYFDRILTEPGANNHIYFTTKGEIQIMRLSGVYSEEFAADKNILKFETTDIAGIIKIHGSIEDSYFISAEASTTNLLSIFSSAGQMDPINFRGCSFANGNVSITNIASSGSLLIQAVKFAQCRFFAAPITGTGGTTYGIGGIYFTDCDLNNNITIDKLQTFYMNQCRHGNISLTITRYLGAYITNNQGMWSSATLLLNVMLPTQLTSVKVISGNRAYKTSNFGTATIAAGNSFVDVTHGLHNIPNKFSIVPQSNMTFNLSSIGLTTFRINIPPTLAADCIFFWTAEAG